MAPPFPILTLLRCPECGSGHYDPPGIACFADLGQNREDFWRFYVEVGAGIWETVWPVLADTAERSTLLDVGCGFGFAVDCWGHLNRGEAVGIELADYGQLGARLLDITVYDQLLQECKVLEGRKFDVVYASEVIEHVEDPHGFVGLLSRYVAEDGLLVLTTPSMDFVKPAQHSPTLHAALAPGFHGFLLSASALAGFARRSGFPNVEVHVFGERQVLWASHRALHLDPTPSRLMPPYLRYLEARVSTGVTSSPVWQGIAYRLIRERINLGRLDEAHALAAQLKAALVDRYDAAISDPAQVIVRLRSCTDLSEVGRVIPYFMPNLYFHLGALAAHVRDIALAQRMYKGAVECTLEVCRFGSIFFLEALSLLWPARAALADTLLMQGKIDDAATLYALIAAEGNLGNAANAHARADAEWVETRVGRMAEHLRQHGFTGAARVLFKGYCEHIRRRYGAHWLQTEGVASALARTVEPAPADPLFAPWFEAMIMSTESRPKGMDRAALVAVGELASAWSTHPRYGSRMRDIARTANAAAKMPAEVGQAVWTMSTKFKL